MKNQSPSNTESARRAVDTPLRANIVIEAEDLDFMRDDVVLVAGTGDCGYRQSPLEAPRRQGRHLPAAAAQ